MANIRKYVSYTIKITYDNGDIEDVNYKEYYNNCDEKSYNNMMDVYKKVRKQYEKESCIIDFLGVSEKGKLGIVFTKEINIKTNKEKLETKSEDIINKLEELLILVNDKEKYHNTNLGAVQKEQDFTLHKIQIYNGGLNGKVKLFDDLQKARIRRLNHKNELLNISKLKKQINVKELMDKIQVIKGELRAIQSGECLTEDNIDNYNIMKEVVYKSDRERVRFMSKYKKKYDKAVVNELEKKITFYNYGYTKKKNKKAM